jgi:hypothetical protein
VVALVAAVGVQPATAAAKPAAVVAMGDSWAIDQFSAMTATAAAQAGVRYLELNGAFNGHEVCAAGASARTEWVRGTFVDPAQLPHGIGINVVQQSMHPHHLGHAQMRRCVTEFYSLPGREARCAIGADGNLHAS